MLLEQGGYVHVGMVFHRLGDAIVHVLPAREPPDLLALRSALQATIARLRAALSALDGLAASAGRGIAAVTQTNRTAVKDVALMNRDIIYPRGSLLSLLLAFSLPQIIVCCARRCALRNTLEGIEFLLAHGDDAAISTHSHHV
jgi:hypothetical protein